MSQPQVETENTVKESPKKRLLITSSTLLNPPIPLLHKDSSNFKAWKRVVRLRMETYDVLCYVSGESTPTQKQRGQLVDLLFAVVSPEILNFLEFDEAEDSCELLWTELLEFGTNKHTANLLEVEEVLNSLILTDPRKALELLSDLDVSFTKFEGMGKPLPEKRKINYLERAIASCRSFKGIHDICTVAGSDSTYTSFANLIKRSVIEHTRDRTNVVCDNCGRTGHVARHCRIQPRNRTNPAAPVQRFVQTRAHVAETNENQVIIPETITNFLSHHFRRAEAVDINKKEDTTINSSNKINPSLYYSTSALLSSKSIDNNTWIFDSGANHTMTWDSSVFIPSSLTRTTDTVLIGWQTFASHFGRYRSNSIKSLKNRILNDQRCKISPRSEISISFVFFVR